MDSSPLSRQQQNEESYDRLVAVIEASDGILAPLLAVCDDQTLREQIIQQYEQELAPTIHAARLRLARGEPSLRAAIATWATEQTVTPDRRVVLTITGAEDLLWLNLRSDDPEKTELDKFFGYLQWTREGLREFPYPIVLWITTRILSNLSRRAPDFWSWRRGVFRFAPEPVTTSSRAIELPNRLTETPNAFLLPLDDLHAQIAQAEQENPASPQLASLYSRLAQTYQNRVERGLATNLEQERNLTIHYFRQALSLQTQLGLQTALMNTHNSLGLFHKFQGRYRDALAQYQESLNVARQIDNQQGEANALGNLGIVYRNLGQYERAIEFYQQNLALARELGDRQGKANTLGGLGNVYYALGQYEQAIEFYQQNLALARELGDRRGEANALGNLGNVYNSLGQYERAIEFYQQHLELARELGDRRGEANAWFNLGLTREKLTQTIVAIESLRRVRELYQAMGLETDVQDCDTAIQRVKSDKPDATVAIDQA